MLENAVMAYMVAVPLVTLIAAWRGVAGGIEGLTRCSFIELSKWAAVNLWQTFAMSAKWEGQPWAFIMLIYALSMIGFVKAPAGKGNAIMTGVTFGGFGCSLVYGILWLWSGYNPRADWIYWYSIFGAGWLSLLALVGWSNVENGRRAVVFVRAAFTRIFRRADRSGVAR